MSKTTAQPKTVAARIERPPVVVVMGHIDHGKSKLLDHIRKTNVVESEVGGITQRTYAYEVTHKTASGDEKRITFLDTPGHAAFQGMRHRGADVADIAILVVSAEEGVKQQTLEALRAIRECGTPFVVAINKIDKPTANVDKTKQDLLGNEIYLEGMGGDVPFAEISAKEGTGVSGLLDLVLLAAELEELKGDPSAPAEGIVIEAHRDPKKGMSATLIVKDGALERGEYIISGESTAPVRILLDFAGTPIERATFSSPVSVIGFDTLPSVGASWHAVASKKEARGAARASTPKRAAAADEGNDGGVTVIPLVVKADISGSLDALLGEIAKVQKAAREKKVLIKVVHTGVGDITEGDVKMAGGKAETVLLGFSVGIESTAADHVERLGMTAETFDIIYKVTEHLEDLVGKRAPKQRAEETTGKAKVLKTFSAVKNRQVIGGRVIEGTLAVGERVRILRHERPLGDGIVKNLQQQKTNTKTVTEGEFGAEVDSKTVIAPGDILESYRIVEK